MRLLRIKNLTFALVTSPKLIFYATGWKRGESTEGSADTSEPRRNYRARYGETDLTPEIDCVDLVISILNALDDESLALKEQAMASIKEPQLFTGKRHIPVILSQTNIDECARPRDWPRYALTLQSLGFVLNERCEKQIRSTIYERIRYDTFTDNISQFPLLEAFFDRDRILIDSGLFKSQHISFFNDRIEAVRGLRHLDRLRLELPAGLLDTAEEFHGGGDRLVEGEEAGSEPKPLNPKERTSMLLLINAMASAKFKYVKGESLGAPKQAIENAILDAGLDMSQRTIGEYLKKAQSEADEFRESKQ